MCLTKSLPKTPIFVARIRLAESAREDLREIRFYSRTAYGPAVARDYLLGLRKAFDLLGSRPLAGVQEADLGVGIRSFSYRSHRIFYHPDAQGIVILRILHQAQERHGTLNETR